MSMTTLEVLMKARELIATPERCSLLLPAPVCWCLKVAIIEAVERGDIGGSAKAAHALGFADVLEWITWNDAPERTHAEVLARLDAGIEREKEGARS